MEAQGVLRSARSVGAGTTLGGTGSTSSVSHRARRTAWALRYRAARIWKIVLYATAQSPATIMACDGCAGRCAAVNLSLSLELDAGGDTAIIVAPAKRAVATAIFKHVDIDVATSLAPFARNVGSLARARRSARLCVKEGDDADPMAGAPCSVRAPVVGLPVGPVIGRQWPALGWR